MNRLFIILFMFSILFTIVGCGETSSDSSNLTIWTLSDPYSVGGDGTLDLSSTTEGKLDFATDESIKNVTTSLGDSSSNIWFVRDENGNILSGNIISDTSPIDLSN